MGGSQSLSVPADKHVVIIGAGYAGLPLACKLKDANANFTLISSRDACHLNLASVRAAVKPDWVKKTLIPLEKVFGEKFKLGKVTSINSSDKKVTLESGDEISYDILVIATGSSGNFPNKLEDGQTSDQIIEEYAKMTEKIKEANKVLVIGAGPTGIEQAGELAAEFPDKEITIIHGRESLLDDKVQDNFKNKVLGILQRCKVNVILGEKVVDMDKYTNYTVGPVTVSTESGKDIEADFVFKCTGLWTNSAAYKDSLGDSIGEFDRLKVDDFFAVEGQEDIYALGDCSSCKDPKLAFAASQQAVHLFDNLKKRFNGQEMKPYKADNLPVAMVLSVGPSAGSGQTKGGWCLPEFLVKNLKCKDLGTGKYWKEAGEPVP